MKHTVRWLTPVIWMSLMLPVSAIAQSGGERLSDKDVREVIDAVDHSRDRFEDQLDGKIKDSIVRGPRGEVRVEAYLQDLQDNVKKLKERFSKTYSGSAEASTLLQQASRIHTYLKSQPGEIKGGSEWDRLAIDLNRLADAYNTTFPLKEDAAVRRINDAEAASNAEALAKQADTVKSAIDRESALTKDDRRAFKHDLDEVKQQAKTVKERASDSKPATAEARQLVTLVDKLNAAGGGRKLQPATLTALGGMRAPLNVLAQAYRIRP
jgi:uncharacterized phage infection (PIP) family protein YhgE